MIVKWSPLEGCYRWDCIYGCQGSDYRTEREAELAYDRHDCGFQFLPEDT